MTFYFAWVDSNNTAFETAYKREDEEVLAFEISHEEGDFAALRIDVRNPRIGLLEITRKRWAWLAYDNGTTTTPLFFGRLIGLPQELRDEVVTLSFIAKPLNYQSTKTALAATMKQPEYFDPLFIEEGRREEADTVLEARPSVWCIDRTTHALTASNVIVGEAGTINFASDAFADSVRCSFIGAPQRKVIIEAEVSWNQYAFGSFPVTFSKVRTYTGDGLLSDWPKQGAGIGGGWFVKEAFAKDAYTKLNTTTIADRDGVTQYYLYNWNITGTVECGYEASRQYVETATFTLQSDVQEIVTETGDEELITISVSGDADEPVDAGDTMPIGDLTRRVYFTTERGKQSVKYLANIAAARLLTSARCVEISFEVPFSYATSLSLRHSGSITDPRLPGGTVTGKIKSYRIFADGATGVNSCFVTLASTPGSGGSLSPAAGTPTYATSYADSYQVTTGGTITAVLDASNNPTVTVADYDTVQPNDDGIDLTIVTAKDYLLEQVIENPASVQQDYVFSSPDDTGAALSGRATRLGIRLKPIIGGPFETPYSITASDLIVPKLIDLEASA